MSADDRDPELDTARVLQETFVAHVEHHRTIDSTNTRGLELAATSIPLPALVAAERQTAGRGRGHHRWWSAGGSLTVSLLVDLGGSRVPSHRFPWISLATGLAIAEALTELVPDLELRLKWPNDVFLRGKKLGGILIETSSRRAGVMVLGWGINVNNSLSAADPTLQGLATSLKDQTGQEWDRTEVLVRVLRQLESKLSALGQAESFLADQWRKWCCLGGQSVQLTGCVTPSSAVQGQTCQVTGLCQSIDDEGALLVQTETGLVRCLSGTVARWWQP